MLVSGMMTMMLNLFADNIAFKLKVKYFSKCLEKDAAFFDVQSPTEMTTKISKEVSCIHGGLG